MRLIRGTLLALFALTLTNTANASLLLEPYVGYTFGSLEAKYTTPNTTAKWDNNNLNLGGRLGYQALLFQGGIDYQTVLSGKLKGNTTGTTDYDITTSTVGAFVGVRFPFIRARLGYGFSNELKLKASAGGTDTKYTGTAIKAGVAFTALPLVALNLDYIMNTYDKVNGSALSAIPGLDKMKADLIMLSISAPFDF